mmetsp:Transcript_7953/g.17805  ORF Transcript_7953/g.17805 Transcript_7953/m.17805 type:complete len:342 (-) Transcript_7953:122-1147(-)
MATLGTGGGCTPPLGAVMSSRSTTLFASARRHGSFTSPSFFPSSFTGSCRFGAAAPTATAATSWPPPAVPKPCGMVIWEVIWDDEIWDDEIWDDERGYRADDPTPTRSGGAARAKRSSSPRCVGLSIKLGAGSAAAEGSATGAGDGANGSDGEADRAANGSAAAAAAVGSGLPISAVPISAVPITAVPITAEPDPKRSSPDAEKGSLPAGRPRGGPGACRLVAGACVSSCVSSANRSLPAVAGGPGVGSRSRRLASAAGGGWDAGLLPAIRGLARPGGLAGSSSEMGVRGGPVLVAAATVGRGNEGLGIRGSGTRASAATSICPLVSSICVVHASTPWPSS